MLVNTAKGGAVAQQEGKEAKGVEAVERALKILDCFGVGARDLSLADIARLTGEYKSTILRLIVSLERFGYVVRDDSGRYRLGASLWRLGAAYRDGFDLTELVRPEVLHLSQATNETASFYIREGDHRVCLFRAEPARSIRHSVTVGGLMPLDRGATGRLIKAFTGDASDGALAIRTAGHVVSLGERDPEVAAVAVPVLAADGRMLGALAVSGLDTRFTPDLQQALLRELSGSQQRLGERLGRDGGAGL